MRLTWLPILPAGLLADKPTFTDFVEDNYACSADAGFVSKCVSEWQEECRETYHNNTEMQEQLCESHLDRNYVRIRTLIPPDDILDQWKWDKKRRDFDEGFFRSHLPKYTETGAKLTKMPDHLHKGMRSWLERHRTTSRPETSRPAFGIHCNTGHDNDDWVIPYTSSSKEDQEVFAGVKEWIRLQLAEWTGQEVNELTAIYGARQYHRGSICGMHTDNIQTHAFSAIYQLDQRGMEEPWALDYVTHDGKEGRVFLKEGEVNLYESATLLHGRRDPLKGDEFTNIFFHFRSPQWLPVVNKMLEGYWDNRHKFESATGTRLTSLADAPKKKKRYSANDQCIALRSRSTPLMVEGHFMDMPDENEYTVPASSPPPNLRQKKPPDRSQDLPTGQTPEGSRDLAKGHELDRSYNMPAELAELQKQKLKLDQQELKLKLMLDQQKQKLKSKPKLDQQERTTTGLQLIVGVAVVGLLFFWLTLRRCRRYWKQRWDPDSSK